jgi:adenylate cyclase
MAVWGAPVSHAGDAEAAVSAALQMLEAVDARNAASPGGPQLRLGVGLNTGPVLAGSVGSARRTEYTVIGDVVNVASRLCGQAQPGEVLLGEATAAALGPIAGLEPLPPVRLKGKQHPVPLYRATPALGASLASRRRF